ncbi:tyrosine-type recombinase/integrase [Deinococcus sp. SDU3-2]|uniref:Tyrosine-type recombinase/integrase n=1 Tax=Deinococcus terrestris TaxID=2651870 RepID=A0A7X1NZY2_9DEIO|nr:MULTISPECIES: tyrosine-type recombinase/integrase [Deinococcus]MPY68369.1 tyrosine-type recombinase/integrase [Deinococcus terrestris]
MTSPPLNELVPSFIHDLSGQRSAHTLRAYAADLRHLTSWLDTAVLDEAALARYFAAHAHWKPATVGRKHVAFRHFCTWGERRGHFTRNVAHELERVRLPEPHPRGLRRAEVERILAVIPAGQPRDRLLFRLLFETGLRIGEVLGLHLEDLDLTKGDEHLTVLGKGGRKRTILLDDPRLVAALRQYLRGLPYTHGHLFQALKNGKGGAMGYSSIQERWQAYTERAEVKCSLHQLRHSHATELVNGGVSLETIRKRLGHRHIQTTLRYAEVSDQTADAEMRAWRRKRGSR